MSQYQTEETEKIKEFAGAAWRREQLARAIDESVKHFHTSTTKTIGEWTEANRILPDSNSEPGPFRMDRTPYMRGILETLHPNNPARTVCLIKGTQVGGSSLIENTIGFYMCEDPANILMVLPTQDDIKKVVQGRVFPMIEQWPQLSSIISPTKKRDGKTRMNRIQYPGGALIIGSANSPSSLRSMNARIVMADEVDIFPESVKGEGNPIELLRRRMSSYTDGKYFITSTPKIKDASRIESVFAETDQRYFFVPCPHCKQTQTLEWDRFRKRDDGEVVMDCESCGKEIEEHHKNYFLPRGEWIATKPEKAGVDRVGFHLSSLYSPMGWFSWKQAWAAYEKGLKDESEAQVFHNLTLGQTYEFYAIRPKLSTEPMKYGVKGVTAPNDVVAITAGIDTQDRRLECYVYGWCRKELPIEEGSDHTAPQLVAYALDFFCLKGDTDDPVIWQDIYKRLKALKYKRPDGREMYVDAMAIDRGGHRGREVNVFVSKAQYELPIYAVKGRAGFDEQLILPTGTLKHKYLEGRTIIHYTVRVDPIKSTLAKMMNENRLQHPMVWASGETVEKKYQDQLSSEVLEKQIVNGYPKYRWVLKGRRNEALDCFVYAYAALYVKPPDWVALAKNRGAPVTGKPKDDGETAENATQPQQKAPVIRAKFKNKRDKRAPIRRH